MAPPILSDTCPAEVTYEQKFFATHELCCSDSFQRKRTIAQIRFYQAADAGRLFRQNLMT